MLDVVRMFLEDCPIRVAAIRAAIEDADTMRIRATAHTLKGAAAYLSAGLVVDAAAALEMMGLDGRVAETAAGFERLDAAVAELLPDLRSLLNGAGAS